MKKVLFSTILVLLTFIVIAQESPLWLRNSVISPDGSFVAFTYKGNIFTVPVSGGKATQLTSHTSYDTRPIWSPDGEKIAFASNREGGFDVFVVSSKGGTAKRLTSHSANEYPEAFSDNNTLIFSSHIMPVSENQQFPSTMFSQLYTVDMEGQPADYFFSFAHGESLFARKKDNLYRQKRL